MEKINGTEEMEISQAGSGAKLAHFQTTSFPSVPSTMEIALPSSVSALLSLFFLLSLPNVMRMSPKRWKSNGSLPD